MKRVSLILTLLTVITLPLPAQQSASIFRSVANGNEKLPPNWASTQQSSARLLHMRKRTAVHGISRGPGEVFGRLLGPVPKTHAATNGIIVRHGYIAAEFGTSGLATRSTASRRASSLSFAASPWSAASSAMSTIPWHFTFTTAVTTRHTTPKSPGRNIYSRPANGKARCGTKMRTSSEPTSSEPANRNREIFSLQVRCGNITTFASTVFRCRCCACSRPVCPLFLRGASWTRLVRHRGGSGSRTQIRMLKSAGEK